MKKAMPFLLLFSILLFCTQEDGPTIIDVVDLIPQNDEISGWTRDGAMDVAENETQLWDLINGEGVVYVDHGFVKCAFQDFVGDVLGNQRSVLLRAFDMGDSANAYAVYHDSRIETGVEVPWTETGHAGIEARIESSVLYHKIEFWEEKFHIEATINDATPEALNIAKLFAINVSDAIKMTTGDPEN
ncbi:MAG: hypothetical protein JSV53_07930 [candidate division WOR-3 bacterium]|nr:MAG: hypothetical protein JSV53_07930 [candidate division WOR-3 bacterium]